MPKDRNFRLVRQNIQAHEKSASWSEKQRVGIKGLKDIVTGFFVSVFPPRNDLFWSQKTGLERIQNFVKYSWSYFVFVPNCLVNSPTESRDSRSMHQCGVIGTETPQ